MSGLTILHKAFEEAIGLAPYIKAAAVIGAKLEKQGIVLSNRELDQLAEHLRSNGDKPFRFNLQNWWKNRKVSVEIDNSDIIAIERATEEFMEETVSKFMPELINTSSISILKTLRQQWPKEYRRQKHDLKNFRKRLNLRWNEAIEALSMCETIARELGEGATELLRASRGSDFPCLVDVLPRLHARSCQITSEVIALLETGFADGAMARWRTLHEIAVVATLLCESGEELAQRYLDHQLIESYRAAKDYKDCSERLGYEPLEDLDFQEIKNSYEELKERYGKRFCSQYGWASQLLKDGKNPTFKDLEEIAGIDHMRAHYRMASHNVHANPKGVYFKLGLLNEEAILLTGPSNFGLADPGHCTSISLLQVTVVLCTLEPNLDTLVGLKILDVLVKEIGDLFSEIQSNIEHESG